MLKYEIGEKVWLDLGGILVCREIIAKSYWESKSSEQTNERLEKEYILNKINGKKCEHHLFKTKQDLLDHLSNTAEEDG